MLNAGMDEHCDGSYDYEPINGNLKRRKSTYNELSDKTPYRYQIFVESWKLPAGSKGKESKKKDAEGKKDARYCNSWRKMLNYEKEMYVASTWVNLMR